MSDAGHHTSIDDIADSFAARLEKGERPSIEEYKRNYPALAKQIDAVFPALVMLEDVEINPPSRELAIDDSIPKTLGEYEIIREVGRGGMGIVFEAEHATMRRRVALKVLPKSSAEKPSYLNRFFTEARSAGQLHHTNIVPVFEFGEADGLHFYAMQFILGDNLDRVIEEIKHLQARSEIARPNPIVDRESLTPKALSSLSKSIAIQMTGGATDGETRLKEIDERHVTAAATTLPRLLEPCDIDPPKGALHQTARLTGIDSVRTSTGPIFTDRKEERVDSIFEQGQSSTIRKSKDIYHKRVAAIGVQVADALEHAHSRGVLHRDVKPANLILDTDGNVWVTDFGLAKLESNDLTQTGDIIGTLRYMAPERFDGNADCRSDIYSLGLTLYELCTLRSAFDNQRGTIVKDVANSSVITPRKIDDSIPLDLETIIMKAIESHPDRRYDTANSLAEDLNRFLTDRPIHARRISIVERIWRICKRNPVASSMAACILALLSAVAIVVAFSLIRFADIKANQLTVEKESKENSQVKLFYSKVDQAKMRRFSGRLGQRYGALAAIKDAAQLLPQLNRSRLDDDPEILRLMLRNEAIAAMSLTDIESQWDSEPEKDWGGRYRFAVDRKCERFAEGNVDGRVRIRRVSTGEEIATLPAPMDSNPTWTIMFSPNGRYLVSRHHASGAGQSKMQLFVWDLQTPTEPVVSFKGVNRFCFSDDSQAIALAGPKSLEIYSLENLRHGKMLVPRFCSNSNGDSPSLGLIEFNDEATEIAVSRGEGKVVEFWNVESEPEFIQQLAIDENVYAIDWRSNRNILAIGSHRGGLYTWGEDLTAAPRFLQLHQNSITKLHIHPTRDLVATTGWDGMTRLTDLLAWKEVLQVQDMELLFDGFSDVGRIGFTTEKENLKIGYVAGPLLQSYAKSDGYGWKTRFHPVFPQIVARTSDQAVEFWDIKLKRMVFELTNVNFRELHYSRDGKTLFASGEGGFDCWNVSAVQLHDGSVEFSVDSPRKLIERKTDKFAVTRDEEAIAVISGSKAVIIRSDNGELVTQLGSHKGLSSIEFSADDRYLLTGTWRGHGVKVWDVNTGDLVQHAIPDLLSVSPAPHPVDPNMFISVRNGYRTNHMERNDQHADSQIAMRGEHLDLGTPVFSRTGELLAAKQGGFELLLIDPKDGRTLATIESVDQSRILGFDFSPDANQIAMACFENLQIIDVKKICSELKQLGLDW